MRGILVCILIAMAYAHFDIHSSPKNIKKDTQQRRFSPESYRDRKISTEARKLTGADLVDYVNRKQSLWKAELHPRLSRYPDSTIRALMGVRKVGLNSKAKHHLSSTKDLNIDIPESFDSREHWPECGSIKNIRDQSSCGSCWAIAAVEAMSDRICIASKGKIQVSLSTDDLISCCYSCGSGCNGGFPYSAWEYWAKQGIVTGSNFTAQQGCKPYPFPPCEHHTNKTRYDPCPHDLSATPKCERKCVPSYTEKSYKDDKFYGQEPYEVDSDVAAIQKEILANGPVEVDYTVYEDFLSYAGGIYTHTAGSFKGGHAVKLIGWGTEQGTPYWLIANSWNTDFGENGYFRILRGVDECGIESDVVAGIPRLD